MVTDMERPLRFPLAWTVGTGAAVGAISLALDEVPGPGGAVLRIVGGAFAWGTAALLAGYLAPHRPVAAWPGPYRWAAIWAGPHRRAAQARAMALLVAATIVYYGLIVAIGHRWRGAVRIDGGSAFWSSLASVGRALALC